MIADLEKMTVEQERMFHPDKSIAARYNTFLQTMFQITNPDEDFTLDLRGICPQVAKDKGDYLTIREINPYVVITSPEQASAPLVNSLFSFDEPFMRLVYQKAAHVIANVTPNEILWGEIENGIDILANVRDLLRIEKISLKLDTPLETIKRIRALQEMHANISQYIFSDDKINAMIESQKKLSLLKYGDVRGLNVNGVFPITMQVSSFRTALFGGLYVIRDKGLDAQGDTILVHSLDSKLKFAPSEGIFEFTTKRQGELLDFLERNGYVEYDFSHQSIERAIKLVEDNMLLEKGFDFVPNMECVESEEQYAFNRKRGLLAKANSLPPEWSQLNELLGKASSRRAVSVDTDKLSYETRMRLAVAAKSELIPHLLLQMDPYTIEFERMSQFDPQGLVQRFEKLPANARKYCTYKIHIMNHHPSKSEDGSQVQVQKPAASTRPYKAVSGEMDDILEQILNTDSVDRKREGLKMLENYAINRVRRKN